MAGSRTVSMPEPVCLIENDEDGKLRVVRSSQEILDRIDQHVVVVSVVGLYRTGKSYLMNKLAGKTKGFALGPTIQAETKGIWMWCVPHPKKPDHTLVLLDTEGLGDVEKGDETNDNWIFALAVLLSSTLVYNSLGTIDNNALERLHYVTELTEHIKVKSNQRDEDDSDYMRIFPSFMWTVRDFTLQLEADGQPITSDQYLENALQLRPGVSKKIQNFNLPRSCLRNYFTPRWCFVFERPANAEKMKHMEDLSDADLEPRFVQQARRFCDHIFTKTETKTLKGGMRVTGRLLGNLAETYVASIRSGQIPCVDNAVVALSLIENSAAVERARVHYEKEMAEFVTYPTDTQEDLSEIHGSVEKAALAVFMQSAFKDDEQKYQAKLMQVLQEEYKKICEKNYQESQKVCEDKIKRIFADLEEQLGAGSYMTPGGYNKYCSDLRTMTSEYRSEEGKGVKAEEVLKVYLDGKASIGHAILAADESLTEAEQKAEEEKAKREASDRETRALEEKLLVQQRLRADQQRTHEENVNQLTEKIERDRRNAMAEHDKVLEAKLKEQRELLQQGFDERASLMKSEIEAIKAEKKREEEESPSFMRSALDSLGTAAIMFLPGMGKVGGLVAKGLSRLF